MANDTPESNPAEKPLEAAAEETASASDTPETQPADPAETAPAEPAPAQSETPDAVETAEGGVETVAESSLPELTIGQGAPGEAGEEPAVVPVVRGKVDRFGVAMGTGRRKTAVARVRIKAGSGQMTINGRMLEEYLRVERDRALVLAPLKATEQFGKVDVWVRVNGGGTTGQTGAIELGIARALQAMDPSLHHTLSTGGYLTRDGRMVERKKYGLKKARRSFQFSKR